MIDQLKMGVGVLGDQPVDANPTHATRLLETQQPHYYKGATAS